MYGLWGIRHGQGRKIRPLTLEQASKNRGLAKKNKTTKHVILRVILSFKCRYKSHCEVLIKLGMGLSVLDMVLVDNLPP